MEKTDGDLKSFLLALLEVILKEKRKLFNFSISFLTIMKNDNLNSENFDEDKAREDAAELTKNPSFKSDTFLDIIKTSSRKQLKLL